MKESLASFDKKSKSTKKSENVVKKKYPDATETWMKLLELVDALKSLETYTYMDDKKFLYEMSRLAVISSLTKSSLEKHQKLFQMNIGKNLTEFGDRLAKAVEGYQNSKDLVEEVKKIEKYVGNTQYTGCLLQQVEIGELLCNVKKELEFAANNFFEDYNENIVKPIKYYSTIEDFENPNIRNHNLIPVNMKAASSIWARFSDPSNRKYKMQQKTYKKITNSLDNVSEENIDIVFCNNAMKAYNILDDFLNNYLEIDANYSSYQLASEAFPRMKKLLRAQSFSSVEEFREAFIKSLESEVAHIEWQTEWDRREREREAALEREREEERKRRELEYEIKEAIRNVEKANEERKRLNDNLEELNRTLDDIERDIKYR